MTTPMPTAIVDCHDTTAASWRRVNPSVFRSASSRRRRRTDAISVSIERGDGARGERRAQQRGGPAHRSVVDDLGGTQHAGDATRGRLRALVDGRADLLERVQRGDGSAVLWTRINTPCGPANVLRCRFSDLAGNSRYENRAPVPMVVWKVPLPIAGMVAVPTIRSVVGFVSPASASTVSPRCLCSCASVLRAQHYFVGLLEAVAREERRCDGRAGAGRDHGHRFAVEVSARRNRSRSMRSRTGRGRAMS